MERTIRVWYCYFGTCYFVEYTESMLLRLMELAYQAEVSAWYREIGEPDVSQR